MAEPAAVRRAREAKTLQKACADAARKNISPVVDGDYTAATPRLTAAAMYTKAVRGLVEPFLTQPGQQQKDDNVDQKPAGCLNAACPAGLPERYLQAASLAALETQSWAMAKARTVSSLPAKSRRSKLLQRALDDAKQKHDEMQEYIEALRDVDAYTDDWMLSSIAGHCPSNITLLWLDKACKKPGQTGSAFRAAFEEAWSAAMGCYTELSKENAMMAGQLGFMTQMRDASTRRQTTINSLTAAIGCLERFLAQVQDLTGRLTYFAPDALKDRQALPAADALSGGSAVVNAESIRRSNEVAEALLQEEAATSAAASRKKKKAQKQHQAQKKAPPASSKAALSTALGSTGRLW